MPSFDFLFGLSFTCLVIAGVLFVGKVNGLFELSWKWFIALETIIITVGIASLWIAAKASASV